MSGLTIAELLVKDLKLEFRQLKTVSLYLSMTLFIAVIIGVAISGAPLDQRQVIGIFPALLWLGFVFTATVSVGKSFDYERENRALDGLLLAGVPPWKIFIAKNISTTLIVFLGQAIAAGLVAIFLSIDIQPHITPLMLIILLTAAGYSALAVLLSAISGSTALENMLLPVILIPLVFPLFFCAVQLTDSLMLRGGLDLESIWLSLLAGLDVLYIVLGLNLYEHVIRE